MSEVQGSTPRRYTHNKFSSEQLAIILSIDNLLVYLLGTGKERKQMYLNLLSELESLELYRGFKSDTEEASKQLTGIFHRYRKEELYNFIKRSTDALTYREKQIENLRNSLEESSQEVEELREKLAKSDISYQSAVKDRNALLKQIEELKSGNFNRVIVEQRERIEQQISTINYKNAEIKQLQSKLRNLEDNSSAGLEVSKEHTDVFSTIESLKQEIQKPTTTTQIPEHKNDTVVSTSEIKIEELPSFTKSFLEHLLGDPIYKLSERFVKFV